MGGHRLKKDLETLEPIPVSLDQGEVEKAIQLGGMRGREEVRGLIAAADTLINARAVYRSCRIDSMGDDTVDIEGVSFRSRVLTRRLKGVERLVLYVLTIGRSLEEAASSYKDLLEKYCLDVIGNIALAKAREVLELELRKRYALEGISSMSPGSLGDWPIEEQLPLFSLLGDVESLIGVRLNENLVMVPRKSVSGICFPTDSPFFTCQLCPRENCQGRRAEYDEILAAEYGIKEGERNRYHRPGKRRERDGV